MRGFLEHVSLVMDVDRTEPRRVSIMTLHSAKGLEFETVFLPGWEEGLFPHQRALDESGRAGLEEERRLAYVGITRAPARTASMPVGQRVFHQKFGYGRVLAVDDSKLDVEFEHAGRKRVIDTFVEKA
jgi:DNA helicase-2/ATP-dependent DNA helicase PcrA